LPTWTFAQYESLLRESFFGRQPSARAEAMGKAYTSIDGDLATVYFNPAGVGSLRGAEFIGSYTPPGYYASEGYYTFFGAGVKANDYLRIVVSQFQFNLGKTNTGRGTPAFAKHNALTIASEPVKNLYIGLNANLLLYDPVIVGPEKSFYLDFGAIKKFEFRRNESSRHAINIGASISNFTMSVMTFGNSQFDLPVELPVTARVGLNYQVFFDKKLPDRKLESLQFLIQGEYRNVVNSDYYSAYRAGAEVLLFEVFALRAGYYKEEENDHGFPYVNYDHISAITMGLGLQLPLYKLSETPLNIRFDYTSLPQESYSESAMDFGNFTTYSLSVSWLFKEKS